MAHVVRYVLGLLKKASILRGVRETNRLGVDIPEIREVHLMDNRDVVDSKHSW